MYKIFETLYRHKHTSNIQCGLLLRLNFSQKIIKMLSKSCWPLCLSSSRLSHTVTLRAYCLHKTVGVCFSLLLFFSVLLVIRSMLLSSGRSNINWGNPTGRNNLSGHSLPLVGRGQRNAVFRVLGFPVLGTIFMYSGQERELGFMFFLLVWHPTQV